MEKLMKTIFKKKFNPQNWSSTPNFILDIFIKPSKISSK